jgi:putative N6-adenine-specific DNA methylase
VPARAWDAFVSTAPGLEAVTAREVRELGYADTTVEPGGLALRVSDDGLRRLNLHLRTASRVLVRLASFRASSFGELERKARTVPWERVLRTAARKGAGAPVFDVTSRKSRLYHTGAVAERLQRSLDAWGERRPPCDLPEEAPPLRFVVRLLRDELLLSADASGEHLHRRGYRQAVAKAPLRETVAAALVLAAGWNGRTPLFDPFCGSGTLVIEGAMIAAGIAPGRNRAFAFQTWPGFTRGETARGGSLEEAVAEGLPALAGSDRDSGAIRSAVANAARAGVADLVTWSVAPLSRAPFPSLDPGQSGDPSGLLVTNPPWGHRVGDSRRLRDLYARLGTVLRGRWSGGRAAFLCPDRALVGQLALETHTLFRTRLGGIPVEALAVDVD